MTCAVRVMRWLARISDDVRKEVGLPGLLGGLLSIVLWFVLGHWLGAGRLPSPWGIGKEFVTVLWRSPMIDIAGGGPNGLLPHLAYSVRLTVLAGVTGILLGIGVGLLMGWSETIRLLLEAPIEAVRTVPPLAAIPFFLAWCGPGAITQFAVIVFYCSLRCVIYTIEAIRNLPPVYLDFAATLGAAKWQAFYTVVFPGIVPELVGGVRVVIATTWGIDVVAELMGAEFGVGRVFGVLAPMLAASTIIATILWVTAVAVTSDLVFLAISRRLTRWMPESVVSAV